MELEELKKIGNSIGFFKVEELNIDKIKLTSGGTTDVQHG